MVEALPAAASPGRFLKYPGSKVRIAPWVVSHLPPHAVYVEPFCGSAAVLMAKPRAKVEIINDLDHAVVGLFRVLREQPEALAAALSLTPWARTEYEAAHLESDCPVESARRLLVRCWQGTGSNTHRRVTWYCRYTGSGNAVFARLPERARAAALRLREVQIDCRPALEVIAGASKCADARATLIYADPPYLPETRSERFYAHEMSRFDHEELLTALLAHPGPVALSGYASALYEDRLVGWRRVEKATIAFMGRPRTECLWLNPLAVSLKETADESQ